MRETNRLAEQLRLFISVLASVAYLGGGIALIASSRFFGAIDTSSALGRAVGFLVQDGPFRYALAILLIVYGLFRGYRAFQQFTNP